MNADAVRSPGGGGKVLRQTNIVQGIRKSESFERHLKELLSDPAVKKGRAIIAFVTLNGLLKLGTNPGGHLFDFLKSSRDFEWVIGVDAVTTADALAEMTRVGRESEGRFKVRVFQSSESRMFHPKVYIFDKCDGTSTVLVGSNNMTHGGLSENIEVSARLDGLPREEMKPWNSLWNSVARHSDIGDITRELIRVLKERQRQESGHWRGMRGRNAGRTETKAGRQVKKNDILVRFIPLAGSRTSQVHFTKKVVTDFFGLPVNTGGKIRVQQVQFDQAPQPEEHRALVYSMVNRNPKIELNGAKTILKDYRKGGKRPIVVFEKIDSKFYRYMILLSGDPGYDELARELFYQPRKKSLPSWITTQEALVEVWPGYPH